MSEAASDFLIAEGLPPAVKAVVTTRAGGVSAGRYASLNLGDHVGDDPHAVAANRARLCAALELPSEPRWLKQVHGAQVVRFAGNGGKTTDPFPFAGEDRDGRRRREAAKAAAFAPDCSRGKSGGSEPHEADAAVTRERGVVLAVLTADCLPVLLAARDGGVIGIAHAGWRGLAAGVIEAVLSAMDVPAGQVTAWLGPAIGAPHYEVGGEVRAAFAGSHGAGDAFAPSARDGHWHCDLAGLAGARLAAAGVRDISGGRWDTFGDPRRFYSFRRDGVTGRMASLVWIAPG